MQVAYLMLCDFFPNMEEYAVVIHLCAIVGAVRQRGIGLFVGLSNEFDAVQFEGFLSKWARNGNCF